MKLAAEILAHFLIMCAATALLVALPFAFFSALNWLEDIHPWMPWAGLILFGGVGFTASSWKAVHGQPADASKQNDRKEGDQ